MVCGSFKDCNNEVISTKCAITSYLTWFVNEKCYGKHHIIKPIETIVDGKIKSVDYIYTDSDNDLMIHYTDGEAEILFDKVDVMFEIVKFLTDMEELFA